MRVTALTKKIMIISYAIASCGWAVAEEIEEIVVVAERDYYSILPDEPTDSAFGLSKSLAETPRSVTEVREDLIEKFVLRSVDDLVRLTPGAFTSSFFGIRGAMDVRGEPADNYFRGFRRVANPGAFNTIVRGAERLEILRGPVSPLYGSGSVGGQLNYIPKTAIVDGTKYIDSPELSIAATVGTYNQRIISGELGLPFSVGDSVGGVQFFIEVEDSESFYNDYEPSSELYQVAFDIDLNDQTVLAFGGQYQETDSIQVPGWTRVTQELIDDRIYITGSPPALNRNGGVDLAPDESGFVTTAAGAGINDSFSRVGTFCIPDTGSNQATYNALGRENTITCLGPPEPWLSPLTNPGIAKIDHDTTFIDPNDFADTEALTLYADITHTLNNGMVWKTEFFYDKLDHTKYQSWGFTALYPGVDLWEFRSSLSFEINAEDFTANNIVGINYRYEDMELNHAFYDESFDFRDMLVGPTPDDRIAPATTDPLNGVIYTTDGNGNTIIDGSGASPGRNYNEQHQSENENYGIFFLSDISFGGLNILLGGRYDKFDVESINVARSLANRPFDGVPVDDSDDKFSYNASLSYNFDNGFKPYITYAESNSLSTNQVGGIAPAAIRNKAYVQPSEITEIGIKYDGFEGAVYAAIAYYDQEKTERLGETQALASVEGDGFEFELRALLGDNFSILATATKSDTTEIGNIFTVINSADFARQNGLRPEQVYGKRISANRDTILGPNAKVERAGLPDSIASIYGTYVFAMDSADLTVALGVTRVGSTYTDIFQKIKLPSYEVWNGSLSYTMERASFVLQVNNILDEEYYTSADLFDSVVVKPSEGRTASLTIKYDF